MKKVVALLSSLAMSVALIGCGSGNAVSGTATGTAEGNGGEVAVTVTLEDGKIKDVKAEGLEETPGIGELALEQLPVAMVEGNTINVDVVSTATITSQAVIEAAKNAIVELGANPSDFQSKQETAVAEDVTKDCDIVVIGAGGAGMTAAISAADEGKNVIILESQPMVGGNTVRSTGGLNACGTKAQQELVFEQGAGVEKTLEKAADEKYADNETIQELAETVAKQYADYQANPEGYFDTVELFELDTMIGGHGLNNPALVNVLCGNSKAAVEWLSTNGIELPSCSSFGGASVKRINRPTGEDGKTIPVGSYIVPKLEENLESRGIEVIKDATAEKILTGAKGGNVSGVEAVGKNGNKITVNAPVVILATGGFGANLDMVTEYKPELEGFATTNAAGIQGQGIEMAKRLGAGVVDMDQIQIHPTVHVSETGAAALITEGLRGDGAILVNQEGKRFVNELDTRDAVSAAEIAQDGSYAWLIVDTGMKEKSAVIGKYIDKGFAVEGETLEDLAKATEIDAATLQETIDTWNAATEANEDAEFGRTAFAEPLATGPYYAIKVTPAVHHTMGGLMINTDANVIAEDGKTVIPGLYAAGEVTGGVHGGNRLGGNAVTDIIVFGRIAGESASNFEAE